MNLENAYYLSQMLSTIAVVISLIYLGRQTRQTSRNQQAVMHQARAELFHEYTSRLSDPEFGPLARAAFRADENLDAEQIHRFYFYSSTMLRFFEEVYRQWREGLIADERWDTSRRSLTGAMRMPGFRATYKVLRSTVDTGFAAVADAIVDQTRARTVIDPVAEWQAAAHEERALAARAAG